jgi:hypothetical protein
MGGSVAGMSRWCRSATVSVTESDSMPCTIPPSAKMTIRESENYLLSVLDQAEALIDACARGEIKVNTLYSELWDLYGPNALDGHESDEEERKLLERHAPRVQWIWRVLDELSGLCAEEDAGKEFYIRAGRYGEAEGLRRLRALVNERQTKEYQDALKTGL